MNFHGYCHNIISLIQLKYGEYWSARNHMGRDWKWNKGKHTENFSNWLIELLVFLQLYAGLVEISISRDPKRALAILILHMNYKQV